MSGSPDRAWASASSSRTCDQQVRLDRPARVGRRRSAADGGAPPPRVNAARRRSSLAASRAQWIAWAGSVSGHRAGEVPRQVAGRHGDPAALPRFERLTHPPVELGTLGETQWR